MIDLDPMWLVAIIVGATVLGGAVMWWTSRPK
jgi:hypothetical protein